MYIINFVLLKFEKTLLCGSAFKIIATLCVDYIDHNTQTSKTMVKSWESHLLNGCFLGIAVILHVAGCITCVSKPCPFDIRCLAAGSCIIPTSWDETLPRPLPKPLGSCLGTRGNTEMLSI